MRKVFRDVQGGKMERFVFRRPAWMLGQGGTGRNAACIREGTEVTVETVILLDDINEMIDRKILGRLRQYG